MSLDEALRETIREIVREEIGASQGWNWLTSKQAAELLEITPRRVAARVREGSLPGRLYGGRVYVDRAALEKQLGRRGSR